MSAILSDAPVKTYAFETVGDLPLLVIARLVCEWARIDSTFPMRLWGADQLGTHVTIGNDRWYIGRKDKQADMVFRVTCDIGAYGRSQGEKSWEVGMDALRTFEGKARLEPV